MTGGRCVQTMIARRSLCPLLGLLCLLVLHLTLRAYEVVR